MNTNTQTLLVVMPVYNGERTISLAIESILNQSFRNIRLVVIDDCSTDRTSEIALGYCKDPRVSVYRNSKNMGAYYSRNVGLYLFRNKNWGYFTTHDADDVSFEHRYLKLIKMVKKPRAIAVQDKFMKIKMSSGYLLEESLTMAHAVFARKAFEAVGYFENVRFGADWEHWQRLSVWNNIHHYKTLASGETLGQSFIHDKNLTVQIPIGSHQRTDYMKKVRKRLRSQAPQANFYYDFDKELFCTTKIA